jgi:RHS repeat-associated protein
LTSVTISKRNGTNLLSPETTMYFYDNVGNRSKVDLPNGVETTYLYDGLNRLTNMMHKVIATSVTNAVYSYKLDTTGRRTNAVEIVRQEDNSYLTNTLKWQFDGMYHLTNEVSLCSSNAFSYTNSYVYGLTGNRLKRIRTSSSTITTTNLFDTNDELLREVTQTGSNYTETNNYAYDANGSMIGLTNSAATGLSTNIYGYNLMNKLSSLTSGAAVTGFQYNDQGIRVRVTGASSKYFLIDGNSYTGYQQVLEEFTTIGSTPTRSYVIGDDVLAQADGGASSYLLYDGHGSTRQMANNTGGVMSRYNYDGYGVTQTGTTTLNPNPDTSFQYCGEQYDSTLGMYNLRARYYNPSNGRFNQRDAFQGENEDPQSLHKYLYAECDPLNNTDPSGNSTLSELIFTSTIRNILINVGIGGLINATLGAVLNGETSFDQIMYNFGIGGMLGLVGGEAASWLKGALGSIEKKIGWQIAIKLFYFVGKASMNAFLDTIAAAIQRKYLEHESFTLGDFFELFLYNLIANLAFGAVATPLEHAAEESKPYLKLRAYMQHNKHLPGGWQSWSRAAREDFIKSAKFFHGFEDGTTIQAIVLNLSEKINAWIGAHEGEDALASDNAKQEL